MVMIDLRMWVSGMDPIPESGVGYVAKGGPSDPGSYLDLSISSMLAPQSQGQHAIEVIMASGRYLVSSILVYRPDIKVPNHSRWTKTGVVYIQSTDGIGAVWGSDPYLVVAAGNELSRQGMVLDEWQEIPLIEDKPWLLPPAGMRMNILQLVPASPAAGWMHWAAMFILGVAATLAGVAIFGT